MINEGHSRPNVQSKFLSFSLSLLKTVYRNYVKEGMKIEIKFFSNWIFLLTKNIIITGNNREYIIFKRKIRNSICVPKRLYIYFGIFAKNLTIIVLIDNRK